MKLGLKSLMIAVFAVSLSVSSVYADGDVGKGQKLYLKYMKQDMSMTGGEFAKLKKQEEWKVIMTDKTTFSKWLKETYPQNEKIQEFVKGDKMDKFFDDIKSFMINFASDSGNVPSC